MKHPILIGVLLIAVVGISACGPAVPANATSVPAGNSNTALTTPSAGTSTPAASTTGTAVGGTTGTGTPQASASGTPGIPVTGHDCANATVLLSSTRTGTSGSASGNAGSSPSAVGTATPAPAIVSTTTPGAGGTTSTPGATTITATAGSSGTSPTPGTASTGTPSAGTGATPSAAGTAVVSEPFLTDCRGLTLYVFMNDKPNSGASTCTDADDCIIAMLPLTVKDTEQPKAGEGVDESLLGTITRDDGKTQVTYNGWPLYTFRGDLEPGDLFGEGYQELWYPISATGEPIRR